MTHKQTYRYGYDDEDLSSFLNLPNSPASSSEMDDLYGSPIHVAKQVEDFKPMPISPPTTSSDIADEEQADLDDLYGTETSNSSSIGQIWTTDSPVDPIWLSGASDVALMEFDDEAKLEENDDDDLYADIETPLSTDLDLLLSRATTPLPISGVSTTASISSGNSSRQVLQTIPENQALAATSTSVTSPTANPLDSKQKSSKSFPLKPDLLALKADEDEDEKMLNSLEGRKLDSKQRRQLRNKISAKNFRLRRKEYITVLEREVTHHRDEADSLRAQLETLSLENSHLKQDNHFLRSMIYPNGRPSPNPSTPASKDRNPNSYDWPLAYEGQQTQTSQPGPNHRFTDPPLGGRIYAYGVRLPETPFMPFDPKSLLPGQYTPIDQSINKITIPGMEQLAAAGQGYGAMLQAVYHLYDYLSRAGFQVPMQGYASQPTRGAQWAPPLIPCWEYSAGYQWPQGMEGKLMPQQMQAWDWRQGGDHPDGAPPPPSV